MNYTNYYIGNTEYVIVFKNGTHVIKEISNYGEDAKVIFTGSYEKCFNELHKMDTEYKESLF